MWWFVERDWREIRRNFDGFAIPTISASSGSKLAIWHPVEILGFEFFFGYFELSALGIFALSS